MTVTIIGVGNIGRALILSLICSNEKHLCINIIEQAGQGDGTFLDFDQSLELQSKHSILLNSEELFNESDFIFHCAGVGVKPGASRLSTVKENIKITELIFQKYKPNANAKIIVISNPVDIITYYVWKFSGLSSNQVIGTGTFLDTTRLNYYVRKKLDGIKDVNNPMIGEHGESIVWLKSMSSVGNKNIREYFSEDQLLQLKREVIKTANKIKETQGATIFAVTLCAIEIMNAILEPTDKIFYVSSLTDDYYQKQLHCKPIYLSLPVHLSYEGIKHALPLNLEKKELKELQNSAKIIESYITH